VQLSNLFREHKLTAEVCKRFFSFVANNHNRNQAREGRRIFSQKTSSGVSTPQIPIAPPSPTVAAEFQGQTAACIIESPQYAGSNLPDYGVTLFSNTICGCKDAAGQVQKEGHGCRKVLVALLEALFLILFVFICVHQWGFDLCLKSGYEGTCRRVFGRELTLIERGRRWISTIVGYLL
jgi:hypothetical protein